MQSAVEAQAAAECFSLFSSIFYLGGSSLVFHSCQICNWALMRVRNPSNSVERNDEKNTVNSSAGALASFNAFLKVLLAKIKF